jgi:hypothetical protein
MTLNDDAAKAKFGDFDAKLPYMLTTSNAWSERTNQFIP